MKDRRTGFLWEDERDLTDAYRPPRLSSAEHPEAELDDERDYVAIKSRMKSDIMSPAGLRDALKSIRTDLERVEAYHCRVRDQPGGRWRWKDEILPRVQSEVTDLSRVLDRWEQQADGTGKENVREVLADALRPLHDGLDELARALDGEYSADEEQNAQEGVDGAPGELAADFRELEARRAALLAILHDEGLRVIFQHIVVHEGDPLPDKKKGGNPWKWWISRYLDTEYGLVEESAWGYQLTRRGELLNEVLRNLEEKPLLELLGEGAMSTAEAALMLLPHVGADRWEAWEATKR